MRRLFLAVILMGSVGNGAAVEPASSQWHWVKLTPLAYGKIGWEKTEGQASVRIVGGKLSAELNDAEPGPVLELSGNIGAKGDVSATGIEPGTDASPWHYHGRYSRVRTRLTDASNGWGEDRISLVTHEGDMFVGLYRPVRSQR